ncbi:MAG TPA: response regulator transcription factor [Candidatus Acidoferrales bacterium]|nr:response regulator transcription factor [Candidatus Acidoferrales bacterium]
MAKAARTRPLSVCLLSPHTMALEEFQRHLSGSGFRLHARILEPTLIPDARRLRLPRARIYVVDSPAAWQAAATLVAAIQERHPSARLLVVTEKFSDTTAFPLLRLGVKGLLRYGEVRAKLPPALKTVAAGGFWVPRTLLSHFVDRILSLTRGHSLLSGPAGLSPREREVLEALLENLSNKEVAARLNISERTVKFHVSNLLTKFGVRRRADLIVLCLQGGLAGH